MKTLLSISLLLISIIGGSLLLYNQNSLALNTQTIDSSCGCGAGCDCRQGEDCNCMGGGTCTASHCGTSCGGSCDGSSCMSK